KRHDRTRQHPDLGADADRSPRRQTALDAGRHGRHIDPAHDALAFRWRICRCSRDPGPCHLVGDTKGKKTDSKSEVRSQKYYLPTLMSCTFFSPLATVTLIAAA